MLSISNVGAKQAGSYYDKDGYYVRMGDVDNAWYGSLKEDLALPDNITREDFNKLVNEKDERAGFDLCFSAPKSVSLAMCMDEDIRKDMLEAHNRAVEKILAQIEQAEIGARVTRNKVTEHIKTGNMICGRFNHYVSRTSDPQLHTHCVILNKTKYNDKYYAVDNQSIYENKMLYGQLYRNELARGLMQKGYQVTTTNHEKGFFELAGMSQQSMEHLSSRRAEIVKQLQEWDTTSARSAERAALLTRHAKEHRDIHVLLESWKETLTELGGDQIEKSSETIVPTTEEIKAEFDRAVNFVSHRYFAVKEKDFRKAALAYGVGLGVTQEQVRELFDQEMGKEILYLGRRQDNENDQNTYYTTRKNYEMEQSIFAELKHGKNQMDAIPIEKANDFLEKNAMRDGAPLLSRQQQNVVSFIATNKDRYSAVQGLAGTGKTYMLNYARQMLEAEGYEVKGACYTGKAAEGLQQDAKIPSKTIHSFLNQLEKESGNLDATQDLSKKSTWNLEGLKPGAKKEIWIVDEGSMVGNSTLLPLMTAAKAKDAKVIFVGDRQQLLPVTVGNAFASMVEKRKVATITLDEIIRQKENQALLRSVKEAVLGDVATSLKNIDQHTQVIEKRANRIKAIVQEFTALPAEYRNGTVVLTAENKDRKKINENIRRALKKDGQLLQGSTFKVKDAHENTVTREFSVHDKIIFLQNDNQLGVRNGQTGFVTEVKENSLIIHSNGKNVEIDLNQYNKIDYGYAMTTHKAQGITEDRAIIHLDTSQKQLNSRNSYYVDISRARYQVKIFTNNRQEIEKQVLNFYKKLTSDDFLIPQIVEKDTAKSDLPKRGQTSMLQSTLFQLQKSVTEFRAKAKVLDVYAVKESLARIMGQSKNPEKPWKEISR